MPNILCLQNLVRDCTSCPCVLSYSKELIPFNQVVTRDPSTDIIWKFLILWSCHFSWICHIALDSVCKQTRKPDLSLLVSSRSLNSLIVPLSYQLFTDSFFLKKCPFFRNEINILKFSPHSNKPFLCVIKENQKQEWINKIHERTPALRQFCTCPILSKKQVCKLTVIATFERSSVHFGLQNLKLKCCNWMRFRNRR